MLWSARPSGGACWSCRRRRSCVAPPQAGWYANTGCWRNPAFLTQSHGRRNRSAEEPVSAEQRAGAAEMGALTHPVHERLAHDLHELLVARPAQNKRQLLASLQSKGWTGLTTTAINSILYEVGRPFLHDDATPPRWRIVGPPKGGAAPASSDPLAARNLPGYKGPDPRAWQWRNACCPSRATH